MERHFNKVIRIILLCLIANLFNIAWANDVQSYYVASKPLILHTLPAKDHYLDYDSAEIFVDSDNRVIVLSSFAFRNNDNWKTKILLFVFDSQRWVNSKETLSTLQPSGKTFSILQYWGGMINNGVFQAYRRDGCPTIYSLTPDAKLSTQPIKTIKIDTSKKVFKNENYRHLEELLPLEGDSDNFFIVGEYRESRLLNPLNFVSFLTSGGHHGFVERPFGAIVEQDKITGYYNTPEKLETNERSNIIDSVTGGNKVHCVGIRGIEYGYDPDRVQYSYFDLSKKQWAMPVELFREYKHTEKINQFLSPPSLAYDGENVYCTWSWHVFDTPRGSSNWPIRVKESGVYFCSGTDNQWSKPIKIADLGVQPKVVVNRDGTVYVFWIERNKGLFCRQKTDGDWSSTRLVIKDVMIRTKETGIPGSPTQPFGVVVDKNNNLHIIYIRERSGIFGEEEFEPEELIYVKLTHAQK